jgi:hypothetical protein
MNITTEETIRRRTASIPLELVGGETGFRGAGPAEFRDVIQAAQIVASEATLSLQRWVSAGRREGMSWTDIGDVLGISKQAAQQRFRTDLGGDGPDGPDQIEVRLGATAFNEVRILEQEGGRGNELLRVGALGLVFRKTAEVWEYRRVVALSSPMAEAAMAKEGWSYVASWFPFHYFKRLARGEAAA